MALPCASRSHGLWRVPAAGNNSTVSTVSTWQMKTRLVQSPGPLLGVWRRACLQVFSIHVEGPGLAIAAVARLRSVPVSLCETSGDPLFTSDAAAFLPAK